MSQTLFTYPSIRPLLRTGHVVTFEGISLLSRAIKFFAPGGSHTAMVLRLTDCPDTVFLFEALEHGPDITAMSARISDYDGLVHIGMPPVTREQQKKIAAMCLRLKAKRIGYDYDSLFKNARRRVALNMHRGFCSETAQYLLTEAGVLQPQELAMTPGELRKAVGHEITLSTFTAGVEAVGA